MADSEGEEEYDYESSACLDEWGWDPSVDAFLEEMVAEAPRLPNGLIDFSWVSCMFLEMLAPEEDQVAAALEKFSAASLQERFLYLRGSSAAAPDELENEEAPEPSS